MRITVTADVVAWYAAIVATVALVIQGLNAWHDRARVAVMARFGYRVGGGPSPYKPDTDYIIITVANAGRRPRTIAQVGFTIKKDGKEQHIVATDSMVKGAQELTEGKAAMYLVEQRDTTPDDIVKVWAYDQLGKEHRGAVKR